MPTITETHLRSRTGRRDLDSGRPDSSQGAAQQGRRADRFLGLHLRQLHPHAALCRGWHRRYQKDGLVVVGVHAPEFTFARDGSHVKGRRALRPRISDRVRQRAMRSGARTRTSSGPRSISSMARGASATTISARALIRKARCRFRKRCSELNPALPDFPPPMEPMRDSDQPGAVCYRVTPELYLGHARGNFGNPEGIMRDQAHDYRDPGRHMESTAYLDGRWRGRAGIRARRGRRRLARDCATPRRR